MPRLKRFADALGPQSDYSYDLTFTGGGASRASRKKLRGLITRRQRRSDTRAWKADI